MTFIEAAADILEQEGKPLHAKDIAEKAVARGILSHVGKTPVQTMSAQLSAAVLKGTGPFSRVRPGIFALAKWQGKPPGPAPGKPPVVKEAAAVAPPKQEKAPPIAAEKSSREGDKKAPAVAPPKQEKAPVESPPPAEGVASESASQKRRKRRRKKASKSPLSPIGPVGAVSVTASVPVVESNHKSGDEEEKEPAVSRLSQAPLEPQRRPEYREPPPRETPSPSAERPKTAEPLGASVEIADLVEKILRRSSRPLVPEVILDELGIPLQNGQMLLDALLTADAFEREYKGQRARFVKHKSGFGLLEREVSGEILTLENQAADIRRRLALLAERQVLKKLRALPIQSFVRTMIVFLERSGFGAVKPVSLKTLEGFHLSVQDRRRNGTFRTAVVLRRDPMDYVLSERAVMDLRGAMHHFDAMGGLIFTTGQTAEKATMEGRIANLPPVAVVDGETLAGEMVRLGIGVKERALSLPTFDDAFFSRIES